MLDTRSNNSVTLRPVYRGRKILKSARLTENGYTPEFEAEMLRASEEAYAEIANGTAKLYRSVEELFADLDAEDDD